MDVTRAITMPVKWYLDSAGIECSAGRSQNYLRSSLQTILPPLKADCILGVKAKSKDFCQKP